MASMNKADEDVTNNNTELVLLNGIKLNENSTLTHLSLSNLNLEALPECVAQMRLLQHLDLSHNSLQKVPAVLETHLDLLETLNLSHNKIVDFSNEPRCYKRLKKLYLSRNSLNNIPEWILHVRCLNLELLEYNFNLISDLSQSRYRFYHPCNLRELYVQNCRLSDKHLSSVNSIYTLETLDLSNTIKNVKCNSFTNVAKLFIKAHWMYNLKVLKLCCLQIAELPQEIGLLKSLRELHLKDNNLDTLPASLQNLISLQYLDVSNNELYYLNLAGLDNLKYLIADNNIIGTFNFVGKNNLCLVDLYDNQLQNVDVSLNDVPRLDVDRNFIGEVNICDYAKKKVALRQFRDVKDRSDTQKSIDVYEDIIDDDDSGTISDYVDGPEVPDDDFCKQYGSDEELWDAPNKCDNESSSVPDNDWTGETTSRSSSAFSMCDNCNAAKIDCYQLFADAT